VEFFADRNLGINRFPAAVRAAGITLHIHQDHFPQNALDIHWMPAVAARGWIIISPDIRIGKNPLEVDAIMTSGASVFCLCGGHYRAEDQAANFLRCLPQITRVAEQTPAPFIAKVYRPSPDDPGDTKTRRVEVKLTLAEWQRRRGIG
jgi:hypothetical protein